MHDVIRCNTKFTTYYIREILSIMKATKSGLPKRAYRKGELKVVSFRLPDELIKELRELAEEKGWTVSDLVSTVLDLSVQAERKSK